MVVEDELKEAFTKGLLPVNTLVWKIGLPDWKAASEVPELRASVVAGEHIVPLNDPPKPGTWVAQRGGAAASEIEPPSPPSYAPLPKLAQTRPRAPAVSFERESAAPLPMDATDEAPAMTPRRQTIPMGAMEEAPPTPQITGGSMGVVVPSGAKKPAATLIIHAGAPQADEDNGEGEGVPIVVPSPNGERTTRAITQPPPFNEGAAAVLPAIPGAPEVLAVTPSEKSVKVASAALQDAPKASQAPKAAQNGPSPKPPQVAHTSQSPKAPRVEARESERSLSAGVKTPSKPTLRRTVSKPEMPKVKEPEKVTEEIPAPVSTSMILDPDATPALDPSNVYAPVSTSMLLPNSESSKTALEELSADDLEPASVRTEEIVKKAMSDKPAVSKPPVDLPPVRSKVHSIPPPIPQGARASEPDYKPDMDAPARIGLSRPPPPDINPLATGAGDPRRMPTIPPKDDSPLQSKAVPVVLATLVSAGIAMGGYYIGHNKGIEEGGPAVPTILAPTVVVTNNAPANPATTVVASGTTTSPGSGVTCRLAASARMIAPAAWGGAGLEPFVSADSFILGLASAERSAQVMKLDPASLAPVETVNLRASAPLRRVVPALGAKLTASLEVDGPVDGVSVRRTLAGGTGFVGLRGNDIVWSKTGQSAQIERAVTLTSVDIDALRGSTFGGNLAYVYRQNASIWVGTTKQGDVAERIAGLGPQVGTPTLAGLDDAVIAAWVDRPNAEAPWKIRLVRHEPSAGAASEPIAFQATGGLGGACLSPFLLRASGDRVLLFWTEEGNRDGALTHEVRAQLFDAKLSPIGSAFTVSSADMNAGMPRASIGPDGRGLVTFLVDRTKTEGKGVEASGALLSCKVLGEKP